MADAAISMLVEPLISSIELSLTEEISLIKNVKKKLRHVSSKLKTIRNVLNDAEKRSVKEETVQDWLDELKDISYEMDDLLDEWNTSVAKRNHEDAENPSDAREEKISSSCLFTSCISPFEKVSLRHDIGWKIKNIDVRLDSVTKEINDFKFVLNQKTVKAERFPDSLETDRITTSMINESETYGRDFDKVTILSKLLSESSQELNEKISIVSLVGVGGIGKTTLAKLVYNNDEVVNFYHKRIWVCVSDPFDMYKVAREIFEAIVGSPPNDSSPDLLLVRLKQSISSDVKFLLVLDDVWDDNGKKWQDLRNCLEDGAAGSRILITTRNKKVARVMGTNATNVHHIGELSEEASWSLFSQIAFADRKEAEDLRLLNEIGEKIVKKCKGLPLAVRALGSLLRFKITVEEWEDVLDSEIWQLENAKVDLFSHLYLSYNELSPRVKLCFLYCSVFPKDTWMSADELIELWVAQGYVALSDREYGMEVKGREYFDQLTMCCFFQDFAKDDLGQIFMCKMHDIVHDFARYLSRNECVAIANDMSSTTSVKARHLTWVPSRNIDKLPVIGDMRKLRSFFTKSHPLEQPVDLFNHLKCVRALILSNCGLMELPKEIGNLIHLRYLDLRRNKSLSELPESVCELYNLQTLNLAYCIGLSRLPQMIDKLRNLRHLLINDIRLRGYPKSFGRLTNLQTLTMLRVGRNFCKLEYLKHFKHLRGTLDILINSDVEEAELVADAEKAELKNKKHIRELKLRISKVEVGTEAVWEALQPPLNVQTLLIEGIYGTRYPGWLTESLNNLKALYISGPTPNCSNLPPLWKLSHLEFLSIRNIRSLKQIGWEFLGIDRAPASTSASSSSSVICAFPKLLELAIHGLEEWETWEDINEEEEHDNGMQIMPRLRKLRLVSCPKLKEVPHRLLRKTSSLEYLLILSCEIFRDNGDAERNRRMEKLLSHIQKIEVDGVEHTQ